MRRTGGKFGRKSLIRTRRSTKHPAFRRLGLEQLEDRRVLAPVIVTTPLDKVDLNDGVTSLREALFITNLLPGLDTIEFDFGHDGPATIRLQLGELKITDATTIHGSGPNLLTIDASDNDPTPEVHNADGSRIFHIARDAEEPVSVTISGMRLTGGDALGFGGAILNREELTLSGCIITGNSAHGGLSGGGGGVHSDKGELNIIECTISGNYSSSTGGGVETNSTGVKIRHSAVRENSSFLGGGGLRFKFSEASVEHTTIVDNKANSGGGVYNENGRLEISSSLIKGNTLGGIGSARGGGIYNVGGALTVSACTISSNTATKGAGIHNSDFIPESGPIARVINSTISGNISTGGGGGIYHRRGQMLVEFSTITENSGPSGWGGGFSSKVDGIEQAQFRSSIVSGNSGGDVDFVLGSINSFQSLGYNLIGTGNAIDKFVAMGDKTGVVNPQLAPLANNGGPTPTHALLPDSPALNAGNPNAKAGQEGVPLFDQRGEPFSRVQNERIDIGAFEARQPLDLQFVVDTLKDELDEDYSKGDFSLREAIARSNILPSNDTIRFAPNLAGGTIRLMLGELKITDDVVIEGDAEELVTIDASGNDPTPDMKDGKGSRIFNIAEASPANIAVTLHRLRLTGGDSGPGGGAIFNQENLTITGTTITGNSSRENGGGIATANGRLTMSDSSIAGNTAQRGGGIYVSNGEASVNGSAVSNNTSTFQGGGLHFNDSSLSLEGSRVVGNKASADGGGIYHTGQFNRNLSIIRSEIIENSNAVSSSSRGGGIFCFRGGVVAIVDSTIRGNSASSHGGGVWVSGTNVQIEGSTFNNNSAAGTGSGGGLNVGATAVTISRSTFTSNSAGSDGGGALVSANESSIDRSTFSANTAGVNGGGIWLSQPTGRRLTDVGNTGVSAGLIDAPLPKLVINRTTIHENSAAASGGGAYFGGFFGTRVVNSTVSGNTAGGNGGGIARYIVAYAASGAELLAVNTTISGNRASGNGGGVFVQPVAASTTGLAHTTVTANTSDNDRLNGGAGGGVFVARGTLDLDHSIVAANTDNSSIGPDLTGFLGAVLEPRFSLIGRNTGTGLTPAPVNEPDLNGNLIGSSAAISPRLVPLENNGGLTRTHELLPDSPAINRGDPAAQPGEAGVPTTDQRGSPFTRVFGGRIDIGAFERQPTELVLGDFNRNGMVDVADHVMWRRANGTTGGYAVFVDSAGNGDGVVDHRDRMLWMSHYGMAKSALGLVAASELIAQNTIAPDPAAQTPPINYSTAATAFSPKRIVPVIRNTNQSRATQDNALLAWLSDHSTQSPQTNTDNTSLRGAGITLEERAAEPFDEVFAGLSTGCLHSGI
jgi:hypothetical protein